MKTTTARALPASASARTYSQQRRDARAARQNIRQKMRASLRRKFSRATSFIASIGVTSAVAGTSFAYSDLTTAKEATYKAWDFAFAWMPDGNLQKGDTDKGGDRKQGQIVARNLKNGLVLGFNTGLITPQGRIDETVGKKVQLRDTGFAEIVAGVETANAKYDPQYGLYGHLGVINGPVNGIWQDIIIKAHGGHARTSDASSGMAPYLGVSARVDKAFNLANLGPAALDINTAAFANATTMDVSAGLATYASLNFSDSTAFKPTLPGMPMQSNSEGTSLYAGVVAQAFAYDRPTHVLGTAPFRATGVLGVAFNHKNIGIGVEYQKPLLNETAKGWEKPVDRGMAYIRFGF